LVSISKEAIMSITPLSTASGRPASTGRTDRCGRGRLRRLSSVAAVGGLAAMLMISMPVRPASADPGPGQTERIAFAPGTDDATVRGTAPRGGADQYVLWAGAGQTLSIELLDDTRPDAAIAVVGPDGTALTTHPSSSFEGTLPADGDYLVSVGRSTADLVYTMEVSIPATHRVEFAAGTDNGTITGSITDTSTDRYRLWAAAGQTMSLRGLGELHVSVTAPDGSILPGGPGDTIEYQLPNTGDYVVEILPGMGEQTDYTVTVTIPPRPGASAAPRRVQFAAGTDHATLSGSTTDGLTDRYVLRAAAGRTMRFDHVAPFRLSVTDPGGAVLPGGPGDTIEYQLPTTGDYVVEILPGMGEGDAYEITVTIPALPHVPNQSTRRVTFAAGTDHATITGSITDDVSDRYVLRAGAGQTMTLSGQGSLHYTVTAPGGSPLPGGPGDPVTFQLPATGDYTVEILPGMGEQSDYAITISIPA